MGVSFFKVSSKKHRSAKSCEHVVPRKVVRRYRIPSPRQDNICCELVRYLQHNKHERRAKVFEALRSSFGLVVESKRLYVGGGVGSVYWMKGRGCYRVQCGASKIDIRKNCFPYAMCVDVF